MARAFVNLGAHKENDVFANSVPNCLPTVVRAEPHACRDTLFALRNDISEAAKRGDPVGPTDKRGREQSWAEPACAGRLGWGLLHLRTAMKDRVSTWEKGGLQGWSPENRPRGTHWLSCGPGEMGTRGERLKQGSRDLDGQAYEGPSPPHAGEVRAIK